MERPDLVAGAQLGRAPPTRRAPQLVSTGHPKTTPVRERELQHEARRCLMDGSDGADLDLAIVLVVAPDQVSDPDVGDPAMAAVCEGDRRIRLEAGEEHGLVAVRWRRQPGQ